MSLHRIVVSVVAVVLVVLLYNLPRVVVDNDSTETGIQEEQEARHGFAISSTDSLKISRYINNISTSDNNKKNAIFADSLANLYLVYNKLDSAEKYARFILQQGEGIEYNLLAGDIFFKAFGFSSNQTLVKKYGELAADCFKKFLEVDSSNPDVKSKLAMTLVSTATPMQGISMLREVLEEYPENQTALFNLGILSMQSGQHDKAVERFEKLVEVNENNVQAWFYLAVSYFELGQREKAKSLFEKVKLVDDDPAVLEAADNYLKEINEF
ncbi:MAG: tetratricopeptide repeat protein [Cyclobacteriaceae bacterium]